MTETKEYTAAEVNEALENHTWPFTYTHYQYGYDENGRYTRIGEGVERTETAEFSWSEVGEHDRYESTAVGDIEVVEVDEGGEGHGEDIHVVIRVVETGQLFRKNGSYYSHYGEEWDGRLYPVNAVERTVVFYE